MFEILLALLHSGSGFYLIISYSISIMYIIDIIFKHEAVKEHSLMQKLGIIFFMPIILPLGVYKMVSEGLNKGD